MRPLVIEAMQEGVEASLLLQDVGRGRLGSLRLQREVHALMAAM